MNDLAQHYQKTIVPELIKVFGYKNALQAPRVEKITLNTCFKEAIQDIKILDKARPELASIAGQQPVMTRARKSISNFKLRQGMPLGLMVTLRKQRMYAFLQRLINIALPRIRDFRGVSGKAFDGRGNYTLGIKEQIIFPEIDYNKIDRIYGMNITIVTSAKTDDEGRALLKAFRFPFRN